MTKKQKSKGVSVTNRSTKPSVIATATPASSALTREQLKSMHLTMVQSRVLEERLIKMNKTGEGYFWIGGPGEESFSVPLGLLVNKGHGIQHDFLHLHYRSSATILAMGGDMIDPIRQMRCVATDPYSGGRNFVNHYAIKKWNVVPVFSCIEPQFLQALGTAHAQRDRGCKGITIVIGGDAGTAEGDFASALVWSSRPAGELPMLMIVTNNKFGISTPWEGQHGEQNVADRGKAFGIKTRTIDGNNTFESWDALQEAMDYVRTQRKPYLLEARVSRLYGHSSASGANRKDELDPILKFEEELMKRKILTKSEIEKIWEENITKTQELLAQVREEPFPDPMSIYDHVWADENGDKGRDTFAEGIGMPYPQMPPPPHGHEE